MSLRARVVLSIGLVFLLGMGAGAGLAGLHARGAIRSELQAGLAGGRQTLQGGFAQISRSEHPDRDLFALVAAFDGDRHVRASLVTREGRVAAVSHPFSPARPTPAWFARAMRADLPAVRMAAPPNAAGFSAVVLETAPADDVGDVWVEFTDVLDALAAVSVVGFALTYLTLGRALRPLQELADSFRRIGSGDYRVRMREQGPPELAQLSRSFNGMAERLTAMETRNRALEEQLLTLQEEERADLARDLHDEIGPYLFAVNVDAAMVGQLARARRFGEIRERVASIQSAVGHMQSQVKDILARLRPTRAVELGLNAAIEDTVAFWRARHGDIVFDVRLLEDETQVDEAQKETLYRVVQESLNNAVRHGQPTRVEVAMALEAGEVAVRVRDDGVGAPVAGVQGGFGLIGMRERVSASGGSLEIGQDPGGRGWTVAARLPARPRAGASREAAA